MHKQQGQAKYIENNLYESKMYIHLTGQKATIFRAIFKCSGSNNGQKWDFLHILPQGFVSVICWSKCETKIEFLKDYYGIFITRELNAILENKIF